MILPIVPNDMQSTYALKKYVNHLIGVRIIVDELCVENEFKTIKPAKLGG